MNLRELLFLAADLSLMLVSAFYGAKFLRKGNLPIGLELWVVALSTGNVLVAFLTNHLEFLLLSEYLDAFSRSVGYPIIVTAGLLAVTHGFRASALTDIVLFAGGGIIAAIYTWGGLPAGFRAYSLLIVWTAYSVYLLWIAKRLWTAGEKRQALNTVLYTLAAQIIATIYDFWPIPGDDSLRTIFFTFAMFAWAYQTAGLYPTYCALERTQGGLRAR